MGTHKRADRQSLPIKLKHFNHKFISCYFLIPSAKTVLMVLFNSFFFFALILGILAVLQGGMNQKIALQWGYPGAVLLSCTGLLFVALLFYILTTAMPSFFSPSLQSRVSLQSYRWWFILPGIMGFFLVFGIPFAISKIGAYQVFVGLIAAQLIAGLFWDFWVESIPLHPLRIIGGLLSFFGAVLVGWVKNDI